MAQTKTAFFKDTANEIVRTVDQNKGVTFLSPCGNYVAIDIRKYDFHLRSNSELQKIERAKLPVKKIPVREEPVIKVKTKKRQA